MVRTRDFILIFATIGFLVVAIGTTAFSGWQGNRQSVMAPPVPDGVQLAENQIGGAIVNTDDLDREGRLLAMRQKVSAIIDLPAVITEPAEEVIDEVDLETSTSSVSVVQLCSPFTPHANFWDARGLSVEKREGAIVVERSVTDLGIGTTTVALILQISALTLPAGQQNCLYSDVVGIASDGSLIRNDEVGLYGIFGADTLIGYALDGFPMYGTGNNPVDNCNGRVVDGQYRYELQAGTESIINCFADSPQYLP